MTNILTLPLVTFSTTVGTNEVWSDSWAYLDASGAQISGVGIVLNMMLRSTASDPLPRIAAVSDGSPILNGITVNGALSWGGAGGGVITLAIPVQTMGTLSPGDYVAEVQGIADGAQRTLALITVTITQGIVR